MNCLSLLVALSLHVGLENNYNNIHPHARCTIDSIISGAYYNSEERISYYVGKKIKNVDLIYGSLHLGVYIEHYH